MAARVAAMCVRACVFRVNDGRSRSLKTSDDSSEGVGWGSKQEFMNSMMNCYCVCVFFNHL